MKPMTKMSRKLILSAFASTLATAALALGSPAVRHDASNGASPIPAVAELPAPPFFGP
jgi:hypothetical protein